MSYCDWSETSELVKRYHRDEWGVPVHDDQKQFEFLMMEVLQCGLNWNLVLAKREVFRACFDRFDFDRVAEYGPEDVRRVLATPGMIRSPRKVEAIVDNARCFRAVRREFGSFSAYLWRYSGGRTILYDRHGEGLIPASNGLSDEIAADLRRRGFRYLGGVTVYAHLQACGLINDHGADCPCYAQICALYPTVSLPCRLEKNVRDFSRH